MPINISVDTSGFDVRNQRIRRVFASRRTGDAVANYLRTYHTRFREKWRGTRYMAGPRSNMSWQAVVAGWQDPEITGDRITIKNTFGLLAWKVSGGVILPQRATKLTIPLIPDAKGIRAADFVAEEGTPLFRVGNALMRRIGKKLEAVYALVDAVAQEPWPGALPSNEDIAEVYKKSATQQVHEVGR
jgi:hypothetical protein